MEPRLPSRRNLLYLHGKLCGYRVREIELASRHPTLQSTLFPRGVHKRVDEQAEYLSCLQIRDHITNPQRTKERARRTFEKNKEAEQLKGPDIRRLMFVPD